MSEQPLSALLAGGSNKLTFTTNESEQCVAVTITDPEGQVLAVIWEASVTEAKPELIDDARECLLDVISHHGDFRLALLEVKASNETTSSDELYWQKQIDVLDRMRSQAERALSKLKAKLTLPEEGTKWKHHKGDVYTVLGVSSKPDADKTAKFPVSVFYEGPDGRRWIRTLESWKQSFTPL